MKIEIAFSLGYQSALRGEHIERAPFETSEEAEAYNEGYAEGCARIDDLNSDVFE